MSAIKNYLHDCEDQAILADESTYRTEYELMVLANLAWANGTNEPIWAPDQEWLDVTRTQLQSAMNALAELQAARDSMDFRG